MNIKDKVVLVTGGTSGIGEGCTRRYAELGAKVVFASVQQAEGEALERELKAAGYTADFAYCNVTDEESVKGLVQKALDLHGRIDCCHSNAGVWRQGKVTDFTEDDYNFVMGVNVKGNFILAKYVVPAMEKLDKAGVMVITTSVAAQIGFPQHALYCASKAALEALIRCMCNDHAGKVRVVGVSPGTIDTPMLAATCAGWDQTKEEIYAEVAQKIPVRRMGLPLDIANAAAFLMSDEASYINGTVLVLDGGTLPLPPW
ncbi:MAG: SDR family NAD(P)-dependent oxidoreductase [Armatimonadota bacterium]